MMTLIGIDCLQIDNTSDVCLRERVYLFISNAGTLSKRHESERISWESLRPNHYWIIVHSAHSTRARSVFSSEEAAAG